MRAWETPYILTILSNKLLICAAGPLVGSNAYYNTHSCGDSRFSAGFLRGASRAWDEALHASWPSWLHISNEPCINE